MIKLCFLQQLFFFHTNANQQIEDNQLCCKLLAIGCTEISLKSVILNTEGLSFSRIHSAFTVSFYLSLCTATQSWQKICKNLIWIWICIYLLPVSWVNIRETLDTLDTRILTVERDSGVTILTTSYPVTVRDYIWSLISPAPTTLYWPPAIAKYFIAQSFISPLSLFLSPIFYGNPI